jgi:peptidoglycan-associated lipoprotein
MKIHLSPSFNRYGLSIVFAVLSLTGCASKVGLGDLPSVDPKYGSYSNTENSANMPSSSIATLNKVDLNSVANNQTGSVATVQADNSQIVQPTDPVLAQRSVYFAYDSFVIAEADKAVLEVHAKNLRNQRNQTVSLEGHTDERGGREYNLALGQKRALAVQQAMQLLGVSESQLEPVSFGKESPKALGNTETDYAENRRVDIQYK